MSIFALRPWICEQGSRRPSGRSGRGSRCGGRAREPREQHRDSERLLRLAGEAVIGRLGDIATKLPDEVIKATPEIPWREVKGMRIIAAHAYHRIDYEEVWVTLRDDVPRMADAIRRWQQAQA